MYPVILINTSGLQSDDGIIGGGRGGERKKAAWLLAADEERKGAGQRSAEGERRNCVAPPSSARFSGRMAGASFPRDPRRNAKRGIARVGGKSRDLTTIHTLPYVRTATIRVLFTPPPFRGNQ